MNEQRAAPVSVVITVYNEEPCYVIEAIESVRAQKLKAHEIIVVEDGALRYYNGVYRSFPELRIIRQENQGLSAARNTGLRAATGEFVLFLDGDDRIASCSLATNLRLLANEPDAIMSYGAYRIIDGAGRERRVVPVRPIGDDPYATMLQGNCIGMHATALYRRQALTDGGGFDPAWRACEDYELYLRLARSGGIVYGPEVLADYRHHGANMSADRAMMLKTVLRVLDTQSPHLRGRPDWQAAQARGRATWKRFYAGEQIIMTLAALVRRQQARPASKELLKLFCIIPFTIITEAPVTLLRTLRKILRPRRIDLGSLRQREPISRNFGYERGNPVDRHYIEAFLAKHAGDIKGRTLEVGDNSYTMQFGGSRVEQSEVLHVDPEAPDATYCTDLAFGKGIPDGIFDCVVLTQTLHLLYEFKMGVTTLERILKPGGVLLLTVPGVSTIDKGEWGETWYWSFTPASLGRLMRDQFGQDAVEINSYGNVLTATAFLYGLAESDLSKEDYANQDPQYPVIVTARVQKQQ